MVRTTQAQRAAILKALSPDIKWLNEKIWTYLVADLLDRADDQGPPLARLCGQAVPCTRRVDPWFEAEPLSPRIGTPGVDNESNTKIDLAFGAIRQRGTAASGIEYDQDAPDSWACFIEGKHMADCDVKTTYDLLRNQLERDIESLLCFQKDGHYPQRLYFTLLTPRLLRNNWRARLYGYRMREYLADKSLVVEDIERFTLRVRDNFGQVYPNIQDRIQVLTLNWVSYEDVFEQAFGNAPIDMRDPGPTPELEERFIQIAEMLHGGPGVEEVEDE
jgi:hypothetical protein